ncbi:hypothetical protein H6G80_33735 [Nostoc sp. FACHB-87]|uniref:hypothetical protein n=1 Tax=Nostocales TaxID=1161 RepID=UPI001688EE97|nr:MULTISPECIES: hypothetical protein [Nostocales]MBD2303381.1 hypothetical protein [Nostoc sp. FACHB-190]MBD2459000.1 hypothetical protein [Nostoc sp. FACHB-87]MBD2480011.1 hypothetical protein [Anabaena sp. FACHB-83]MBD2492137.1 hypothetical protein [Aulosira sp. FACHB-615]
MSNIDSHFFQPSPPQHRTVEEDENLELLANRLNPTAEQITEWLQSPQIRQWLNQQMMGIPGNLKLEAVNILINKIIQVSDKDHRVEFANANAAIGVDVLRWNLWAFYRLPYARGYQAPDCGYTLKLHLEQKAASQN